MLSCLPQTPSSPPPQLLTDPFLQSPTAESVTVVWFTEFQGTEHRVEFGDDFEQRAIATTTQPNRLREDQQSRVGNQVEDGQVYTAPTFRTVWRHESTVSGLTSGQRVPYRVISIRNDGQAVSSAAFTLSAAPPSGTPLKILLTSDHQQMPMTAANLQKVQETVGQVDAVWLAGDLVNIPDRASEWFDHNQGNAFFPCLQGHAAYTLEREGIAPRTYQGAALIQSAPLFTAIGNHEVMGRMGLSDGLNDEFNDAIPREAALRIYGDVAARSLKDYSYNTDTYEALFTLPQSPDGGETYYATTFGDIRLVVLYTGNMWRVPNTDPDRSGKYQEAQDALTQRDKWGFGQVIFESIAQGSLQYNWLKQELTSPEFLQARYRVVMLHHPPHSLGDNVVPPYTDPVRVVEWDDTGAIAAVRYDYSKTDDYLIRDVMPLLEAANVQLVFYGHSHIWNRFRTPSGVELLESSNVGNTYGAAWGDNPRDVPENSSNYAALGDPYGLEPILPTLAPLATDQGELMPFVADNNITVFSILDTATGTVSSYRFDTRTPDSAAIKFDEFALSFG
ncbi:MAG: metallophosphoesterase [Kaiparowitsia implicata GSE-PSE-MK54-09C]|nr:metallophosphoesterase [Kaiparowitsia implicata GSE-PSE-MK54-09C]